LAEDLTALGYEVRELPLLIIEAVADNPHNQSMVMNIDHYQHVICTSQYAARILADALDQYWPQMPMGIHWYAIGQASARPLRELGIRVDCPQQGHTSEDLLQLPALQGVNDHKIALVKGKGGRTALATTLGQRGARLEQMELYQRRPAQPSPSVLNSLLLEWKPQIVVLLSAQNLSHFQFLTSQCAGQSMGVGYLKPNVVVPGERVADLAKSLGFPTIIANSAENNDILRIIQQRWPPAGNDA